MLSGFCKLIQVNKAEILHVLYRTDTNEYLVNDFIQRWSSSIKEAATFGLYQLQNYVLNGLLKTFYYARPVIIEAIESDTRLLIDENKIYEKTHIVFLKETREESDNQCFKSIDSYDLPIPYIAHFEGIIDGEAQYLIKPFYSLEGSMKLGRENILFHYSQ